MALYMVMLRFCHASGIRTLIGVFRMNNDNVVVAASSVATGSANNPPSDRIVVPIDLFNSEARNAFQPMLDVSKDITREQVS